MQPTLFVAFSAVGDRLLLSHLVKSKQKSEPLYSVRTTAHPAQKRPSRRAAQVACLRISVAAGGQSLHRLLSPWCHCDGALLQVKQLPVWTQPSTRAR